MRDMEKEIAEWRRGMRETSKHRPQALDELEAHLREEIERLVRSGTSSEEAFELAVAKLGPPGAVGAEFEKLEAMRGAKWKPATFVVHVPGTATSCVGGKLAITNDVDHAPNILIVHFS